MQTSGLLWRIDDRLIHGQIIIGWCGQLPISQLLVCDDQIATTDWEKNLLLMAAPPNLMTEVVTAEQLTEKITGWNFPKKLSMILLKNPSILSNLLQRGIEIDRVNIGGIHYREGRKEYLSYLYLDQEEVTMLRELIEQGIQFECQDLPTSHIHDLKKILDKKK